MGNGNHYARVVYRALPAVSKHVAAALAWSLAMRLTGDDPEAACELLRSEWATLYDNDIVPQRAPAAVRPIRALPVAEGAN